MTELNKQTLIQRLAKALGLSEDTQETKLATYKTKEGEEISVDDASQETATADGEYALEDGRTLIIADGKVAEVREAAQEEEQAEETPAEDDMTAKILNALEGITSRLDALEGKSTELEKSNTALSEQLSAITAKPADKKIVLNAQQEQKTKAQLALERAKNQK